MKNKAIQPTELQGTYTALMTPFFLPLPRDIDGPVDYPKLDMLIEDQIAARVNGLTIVATTAQSPVLDYDEHIGLAVHIFNQVNGRVPIIVSAGSNHTKKAIYLSRAIEDAIGPTTFLHVTGYYNNPPQAGLEKHFLTVADNIGNESNLIMYNVPGRTQSYIESDTVIKLAKHPKIIGLKQAVNFKPSSKHREDTQRIIAETDPDNFRVLSGEDDLVAEMIKLRGYGVISASANAGPVLFRRLGEYAIKRQLSESDIEELDRLQERAEPLVKAVFMKKNPIPLAHIFDTELRPPLVKLPEIQPEIDAVLSQYTPEELGIDLSKYHRQPCF